MCLWFLAHTDLAVCGFLAHADFFVGGKSHRIVRWGVGVVFGLTQIPRIPLIFFGVVNLTELFGGRVECFFDFLIFYDR